jgi:peptidoglycan lytic transglycosylase
MKMRLSIASSAAIVAALITTTAHEASALADTGTKGVLTPQPELGKPTGDAIIHIASVTQQIAQFAAVAAIVTPPAGAAAVRSPSPEAKRAAAPPAAVKPAAAAAVAAKAHERAAAKPARTEHVERIANDLKPIWIRCVGGGQTGKAAWYGGRYVGRQTSSGDRLDTIHPTAAHRTLPLNSLALVTNLANGRTVVVKVTDRGPVSNSLLIDMSPRAAEQLAMKEAGIVPVKVEQVVEVPPESR